MNLLSDITIRLSIADMTILLLQKSESLQLPEPLHQCMMDQKAFNASLPTPANQNRK